MFPFQVVFVAGLTAVFSLMVAASWIADWAMETLQLRRARLDSTAKAGVHTHVTNKAA